jgi:hypothetical protein
MDDAAKAAKRAEIAAKVAAMQAEQKRQEVRTRRDRCDGRARARSGAIRILTTRASRDAPRRLANVNASELTRLFVPRLM